MSTSTQQQKLGFVSAEAEALPTIACVGFISEVGDGKVSDSGNYIVQPIRVKGNGANRGSRTNLLYRPEWLVPGFQPNSIDSKGVRFVYDRNIMPRMGADSISVLQGLAGTPERFDDLASRLLSIDQSDGNVDNLIEAVQGVLHQFLIEEGGEEIPVGYKLKQKYEDTGEVDEKGKKIKLATEKYELGEFFYPTEKNLKSLRAYATRKPEKLKVAFDDETPF